MRALLPDNTEAPAHRPEPGHEHGVLAASAPAPTRKPRQRLTVFLAVAGTLLVWLPILAPLFFSLVSLTLRRGLRFDYLMPAELFPLVLAGGLALMGAALRARTQRKLIGWSFGLALGLLFAAQLLAAATGLASGETEPSGWRWALALASLGLYALAVALMGVGGVRLLRHLLRPAPLHAQGR